MCIRDRRKAATDGACRVIYHAHPANIIAMTYVLPLTSRDFTRVLWQSATELSLIHIEMCIRDSR